MTSFPATSTPDPGIHTDPLAGVPGSIQLPNIFAALAQLPEEIIQDVVNVIVGVLTGVENVIGATLDDLATALGTFVSAFDGLINETAQLAEQIEKAVADTIVAAIKAAGSLIGDVVTVGEDALGLIENIFKGLFGFLGNPNVGGGGGTTTSPGTDSSGQSLQQLLALLDSSTQVPANLLQALAPGTSNNVLTDPNFNTGSYIQGQGLWCWDGWVGTGAWNGINSSIRTIRPGRIVIYNVIGTSGSQYFWGNEPVNTGGSGQVLEYLRDPDFSFLVDWALTGTDPTYFEWINVPYPASQYPMGESVKAGAQWLMNQINQTPGPFIFVMDSQGNQVGAAVYDELRFGSMQSRRNDFLAAIGIGNLRREAGHTFPGYPDPAPGTSGMCPVSLMTTGPYKGSGNPANPKIGNLIDTEPLWWDFCQAGDYFACTPLNGNTIVPPSGTLGGHVGDIGGIPAISLRQFYAFINQAWTGATGDTIITDIIKWGLKVGLGGLLSLLEEFLGSVMQQINNLGGINSPHNTYHTSQPFAGKGDTRTFFEIGVDYLNSFVGGVHPDGTPITAPPVNGVQHQLLGQRVAVVPGQVIVAGAQTMWIDVECPGPAIMVLVNAYDVNGNLLATIGGPDVTDDATIVNPPSSSNWAWEPLQAAFVMPPGAAQACIVLDVEPEAMTTGIVWFDDCVFEVTDLIDSALLGNITGIPQLAGSSVAGPQGIADMETAIQNVIDGLASGNAGSQLTGVQLAALFASQADLALTSSTSYDLGVNANKILTNPSVQPIYNGLQVTGEVTFPLSNFTAGATLPFQSVTAGTTIMGFINCALPVNKGFIEFMAKGAGGSGVYVNVYEVDKTTGNMTNAWSSSDISGTIPNGSWGWVSITIPSADQIGVTQGELVCLEIVAQSSTISVAAQQFPILNNSGTVPQNLGAARTTGGSISPGSVLASSLTYSGTVPFVCFGIADVPPTYEPPTQWTQTAAGLYTYPIPDWLVSGNFLDVVPLGGGGCGGGYAGSKNGQGGLGGDWDGQTYTYGVDISTSVTALTAIVGTGGYSGGNGSGYGGTSLVGYGLQTPTFDAIGPGVSGVNVTSSTPLTLTHNATAGAYVLLAVTIGSGTFVSNFPTYDGVPFEVLGAGAFGTANSNIAEVVWYGLPSAPGGPKVVEFSVHSGTAKYIKMNTISYKGVSDFAAVHETGGQGTALSHHIDCAAGQIIVQAFGMGSQQAIVSGFTGGTERYYGDILVSGLDYAGLAISDSSAGATFGATSDNPSANWCSMAVTLNPGLNTVLASASGGAGGTGGNGVHTAANSNATSTGMTAGNETWPTSGSGKRTFYGGPSTTTTHLPGNAPGGGSAGGDSAFPPEIGADGAVYITARQS